MIVCYVYIINMLLYLIYTIITLERLFAIVVSNVVAELRVLGGGNLSRGLDEKSLCSGLRVNSVPL